LRLLLLPISQNLDYDYPVYSSVSESPVLLSILLLLALFGIGIYLLYRSRIKDKTLRISAFGIFWFFMILLVESGAVSMYPICEHRAYLPSVGFFLALMTAAFMLLAGLRSRGVRRIVVCVFVLVPLVLCYASYARNKVWKTEMSLWEDVVRKSPRNARAHYNLGNIYMSRSLTNWAIKHYQTATVLKPDFTKAYYNLGNVFRTKGNIDMAIQQYESAVWLRTDYAEAQYELGLAYTSKGQVKKAIEHFRAASRFKPDFAEAHFNLGMAYFDIGRPASALNRYKKAVEVKPDYAEAHYNIGLIYCKIKEYKKGRMEFEEVLRIDPDHQEAKEMLGSCEEQ
jgi:tetratricopeptide (TPR) repeat protein